MTLPEMLTILRASTLVENPDPIIKLAARYLMIEFDRDLLPDWVAILANSEHTDIKELVDVVKDEMEFGDGTDAK
jgi:hypothetical protein